MPRYRVKICGITRREDAMLAVDLGADAIGLNFYHASPRVVKIDAIASITRGLPAFVSVVGLFVDPDPGEVEAVLESGSITCLQFHGNETPEFCSRFRMPYIKAIRVNSLEQAAHELEQFRGEGTVLLDAYVKGLPGGTGERIDWEIARALVLRNSNPLLLAGGLKPDNVASAITEVNPYGVDVSSGVESAPGIKDANKLAEFFKAVYSVRAPQVTGTEEVG